MRKSPSVTELRARSREFKTRFSKKTLAKALATLDMAAPSLGLMDFCERLENKKGLTEVEPFKNMNNGQKA